MPNILQSFRSEEELLVICLVLEGLNQVFRRFERKFSHDQVKKDNPQGKNVLLAVKILLVENFRRTKRIGKAWLVFLIKSIFPVCLSEIDQFGEEVLGHQNVIDIKIEMDDPIFLEKSKPICNIRQQKHLRFNLHSRGMVFHVLFESHGFRIEVHYQLIFQRLCLCRIVLYHVG